ncbi:MAG: hypothetical protein ACRDWS_13585 [Acidimicrobiia bacterium]
MSPGTAHTRRMGTTLIALVITTAACGGGSNPTDAYQTAASGLCEASSKAEMGDVDGAGEEFYDTAHQPLHDLAAEVTEVDRGIAARLLEAKEAVESGLDTRQSGLGEYFQALVAAADEALTATGHNPMPCAGGQGS